MENVDITATVDEAVRNDALAWLLANTEFTTVEDWLTSQIKQLVQSKRYNDARIAYNANVTDLVDMTGLE